MAGVPSARKQAGLPRAEPWKPPDYTVAEAAALKAVSRGLASEDQQRRAFGYLVNVLCATYDLSYRPGGDRDTAFAEGKRFVGLQLVKFSNLNLDALRRKVTEQGGAPTTPKEQANG